MTDKNLILNNNLNNNNETDLIDANTIANRLNLTIDNVIHKIQSLNIQPKTYIMKGARKNVKTALYSWSELINQQQQQQLYTLDKKTDKMLDKFNDKELAVAYGKTLENRTAEECYSMGMQLLQITLNKVMEQSKKELNEKQQLLQQLQDKNKQLEEYQNTNQYIQQARHNIAELRAKITTAIRKKAYQNNCSYKETYVKYYKLYDEEHNFSYQENYNNYINTIEKRGHLKDLLNLINNY